MTVDSSKTASIFKNPVLTSSQGNYGTTNKAADFMETLSQASKSAYVGRSKLQQRTKSAVPSKRSAVASHNQSAMKVYIPEEYY